MKEDKAYIGDEIVEGNKLIAKFMGAVWEEDDYGDFGFFFPFMMHRPTSVDALKYHCDWSWIMPVVEKIADIDYINVNISSFDGCNIYDDNYKNTAKGKRINSKEDKLIDSVWQAVIQFITWYNKNKQS